MYELDRPAYLQLLLLIPLLWALFAYLVRYRRKRGQALATPRVMMILAPYRSTTALAWKYILYTLIILFTTLALVNPRIGTQIECAPADLIKVTRGRTAAITQEHEA